MVRTGDDGHQVMSITEQLGQLREELGEVQEEEGRVDDQIRVLLDSLYVADPSTQPAAPPPASTPTTATGSAGPAAAHYPHVAYGRQINAHLDSVDRTLYPQFEGLITKVVGLSEHIYSCQELADKMSCSVRKLDERQMRVQKVLAMVEDIINLKTCAEGIVKALDEGNLQEATRCVKQFHQIEGPAAKASEHYGAMVKAEARLKDTVMRKVEQAVSESSLEDVFVYSPLLGPLGLADKGIKIYESFAQRLLRDSLAPFTGHDSRTPAVQLLPKVFNTTASFIQHHLPLVSQGFKQVGGDSSLIQVVHRETEKVAIPILQRFARSKALADRCHAAESLGAGGGTSSSSSTGGGPSSNSAISQAALTDLDQLLDEIAMVIQHSESYDRFIRHVAAEAKASRSSPTPASPPPPNMMASPPRDEGPTLPTATDLNGAVAELSGYYTVLEYHLMKSSVLRAIQIDESPPAVKGNEAATTSCVDDAFYVLRRCARRALVTGHAGTASAIANYINSTLSDDLLDSLVARVKSLISLPTGGAMASAGVMKQQWHKVKDSIEANLGDSNLTAAVAVAGSITGALGGIAGSTGLNLSTEGGDGGGGGGGGSSSSSSSLDRLRSLNNMWACGQYTVKLRDELLAEVMAIYQDDAPTQQLLACLQDLTQTSKQFLQTADDGVEHVAGLVMARVKPFLQELLGDKAKVSFDLNDLTFAQNEAMDPFAHRLVEFLGLLLSPVALRITERGFDLLQQLVAESLAKRLEGILKKRTFTSLGGLQMDKDVRCIIAFFPNKGSRVVREKFARLTQMASLLQCDSVQDILDSVVSSSHSRLSRDEILAIASLRVDFHDDDLTTLEKGMRRASANN